MSFTLARSAAGFALLAVLAAGCGTAVTAHSSAPRPPAAAHSAAPQPTPAHHPRHSQPVPAAVTAPPSAPATTPAQPRQSHPAGQRR